jgi:hypothetical protein
MMSMASPFATPIHAFAVRALASLAPPDGEAAMRRHRTAVRTILEAAGVEMGFVLQQPRASFSRTKHHALVVWHDVPCDALRLFVPPLELIDETTESALLLLNGSFTSRLDEIPIEDVDALTRLMALMSAGAGDAADLHARFIAPNAERYDEELSPPDVAELEQLWGRFFPFYVGGTSTPPSVLDLWIARVYAFGVGLVERPEHARAPRHRGRTRRATRHA